MGETQTERTVNLNIEGGDALVFDLASINEGGIINSEAFLALRNNTKPILLGLSLTLCYAIIQGKIYGKKPHENKTKKALFTALLVVISTFGVASAQSGFDSFELRWR